MAGPSESDATIARVDVALEGIEHAWQPARDGMATVNVAVEHLGALLAALKAAGFEAATLVTAVDRLALNTSGARAPRFELVHQLHSLAFGQRVRIKCALQEGQSAPTSTHLWPGAAYMERECYDLFGIPFAGHANLKRLLMPEEYGHHPLRKDFPHHGIEPDRLYREWDRERRKDWHPEAAR